MKKLFIITLFLLSACGQKDCETDQRSRVSLYQSCMMGSYNEVKDRAKICATVARKNSQVCH